MNPAETCIRKETVSWLAVILLLLGGYLSFNSLGRYEDPEFVIRQAVVITPYARATAAQVAEEVSDPIEAAIQQLQEVKKIQSISRPGESEVQVEMQMKFAPEQNDLEQIWDKLRRKIADAQNKLPPGAGPSFINDDFGDVFGLFLALTGEGYDLTELKEYAEDLRKELLLVEGVAKISLYGAPEEAVFVEISSSRAARLGIPLTRVYEVLRQQNLIKPSGNLEVEGTRIRLSPADPAPDLEALRQIRLGVGAEARVITLGDLATLEMGVREPPRTLMRYSGKPALGIGISNVKGGNIVNLGDAVRARLAGLEAEQPLGMELHDVSYQGDTVRQSVKDFLNNLIVAIVIVVGVLLAFMGLKSGIIIGLVLLLIVSGTLVCMAFAGIDMHRVSLGALIIALGMLVDNAIVVTDAMRLRIRAGEDSLKVAREVVAGTMWPLFGGTAVGILAFSAIGFSPTGMGEYAGSLFWVIGYSLLLSWVLAITVTPLLCCRLFRPKPSASGKEAYSGFFYGGYRNLLGWVLSHRAASLGVLAALLVISFLGLKFVPPGFMPDSSRPQFVVDYWLPQGTDISKTERDIQAAEQRVLEKPGVTAVTSFIGAGGPRFMLTYSPEPPNSSYGQLLVDVENFRVIPELITHLQEELTLVFPQAEIKAWKFMLGKPLPSKIEAVFRGPDGTVLRRLAEEAKQVMRQDGGAVGIKDDWRSKVPVLRPIINEVAARRAGLSPTDVNAALQTTFGGTSIGIFRDGDRMLPIIARPPENQRDSLDSIETILVPGGTATRPVPLAQLVTGFETAFEDSLIRRQNRFPTIKAQCDPLAGELAGPLFNRLRPQIEAIELPPGYSLSWDGEYEASRESNEGLAISAPYGFAAMILAVVVMFNAIRQAAIIWLTAPLAVIGVTIGLLLFQAPFEFMAILGFLSLIGMMVKNAIVLVDQVDVERRAGKALEPAIIDSAVGRMMPVSLGALTTILGVAPLLLDPFFRSMTVVIMFGLAFATILTLVVIPLFYYLFFKGSEGKSPVGGANGPRSTM
ncbi:MAG: efflux RND transporter permease subunit [Oceanipulchritudo sp.]